MGAVRILSSKRILPSGKPIEYKKTIIMKDPTWAKEHKFFNQVKKSKNRFI